MERRAPARIGQIAPDISFVIPVRNDAKRLARCLASIHEDNYPSERVELIVVDNGSADDSVAVARSAGAVIRNVAGDGVAHLRNVGARAARARIVAFIDADHVLGRGWIRAALEGLGQSDDIAAVGSLCRAPDNSTWVQRAYDRLRGRRTGRQHVAWLGAGNMAVSRRAFEAVGGFDAALRSCEDVDLCKKFRAAGYALINDDRLINVHFGDPRTLGALFRSELWRGRDNIAVSFRAPVTWQELPSVVAPIIQLAGLALASLGFLVPSPAGPFLASLGLLPSAVVPAIRAARMSGRATQRNSREIADNAIVAFVYDLARAVALIAFAGYGVRRR
jgi:glycosyltransferase involved in cell wall biosynthesis